MTIDSIERRQGSGARETFTVRKQSFGVGVERSLPLHSPKIENLEVAVRGDVRRAKLHSLRDRVGEAARVAVRRWGIDEEMVCPALATATEGAAELAAETGNETEAAADTDAEAPAAGETEDSAASEGAEDEEPAAAGDSDEDSAS